jgi:hypothetical protein
MLILGGTCRVWRRGRGGVLGGIGVGVVGEDGAAAEDVGGGFSGDFVEAGAGGGGGLGVVGAFVIDGGAAAHEGVDGGGAALGAEDLLAEEGDVADGLHLGADVGAREVLDEGGDGDVVLEGEVREGHGGIEEPDLELALDVGSDGLRRAEAAEAVLVDGFVRLGELLVGGPGAREVEAFGELNAGDVAAGRGPGRANGVGMRARVRFAVGVAAISARRGGDGEGNSRWDWRRE